MGRNYCSIFISISPSVVKGGAVIVFFPHLEKILQRRYTFIGVHFHLSFEMYLRSYLYKTTPKRRRRTREIKWK